MNRTSVWVTSQFVGWHRWLNAPNDVKFLRDYHRHVFKVKLQAIVTGLDREVEFFQLKKALDDYLNSHWHNKYHNDSCEMISSDILSVFEFAQLVEVSEDGENGAIVTRNGLETSLPLIDTKKSRCFIGKEAEGPYKGLTTLFVPGSASPKQLHDAFDKVKHKLEAVYYGAGNDRDLRQDTYRRIVDDSTGLSLTFEVNSFRTCKFIDCSCTLVSLDPEDFSLTSVRRFCKLLDVSRQSIVWLNKDAQLYITKLDDPLYNQDENL